MEELINFLDKDCIKAKKHFSDWKEAINFAGSLLENKGFINHQYTEDMVSLVEKCGAYIVIMPGVALSHARPQGNVNKNSIAIVSIDAGVNFGHKENDPVKVLFAIAAVNDDEHLKLFQALANYLMIDGNLDKILKSKTDEELIKEVL